jgi:hypothetical protein
MSCEKIFCDYSHNWYKPCHNFLNIQSHVDTDLATAVRPARGPTLDLTAQVAAEKRQCLRQLGEEGTLADDSGSSKFKGTFTYLIDLNGVKHFTRNKGDIPLREIELKFRAMDNGTIKERIWNYDRYGVTDRGVQKNAIPKPRIGLRH